jgi:hypothetical protein
MHVETTINPDAWSEQVERDLARELGVSADHPGFVSARDQLAALSGPQVVRVDADGSATVTAVVGLEDAYARNEAEHAAKAAALAAHYATEQRDAWARGALEQQAREARAAQAAL